MHLVAEPADAVLEFRPGQQHAVQAEIGQLLQAIDDLSAKENFIPSVGPAMMRDSDDPRVMRLLKQHRSATGGKMKLIVAPEPKARTVEDFKQTVQELVDAGAEIDRYMADVTRTFVVGEPDAFQRDLFQIVLAAEERAIARCVPGAEWKEIHLACAVDMVAGLAELGVMRGAAASLVEQEAHLLFFPHGLGHMVGLGVRDGSGMLPGRVKDPRPALKNLRMDLPLAPGYVVTVEPGLYFIPALLNDPARRARFRDCVNWARVEPLLALGGVRIEDNVLITAGAPEVLTKAIPKT